MGSRYPLDILRMYAEGVGLFRLKSGFKVHFVLWNPGEVLRGGIRGGRNLPGQLAGRVVP